MGCQEHVHKLGYRTNQNIQKSNLNLEPLTGHPNYCQYLVDGLLHHAVNHGRYAQQALLAAHQATMCIFLSVQAIDQVMSTLKEGGYPGDTPVAIVARATWPDQRIFRGTIDTIADILHQAGVVRQAMIVVGKVLDTDYELSKLYDSKFTTMFRKGTDGE